MIDVLIVEHDAQLQAALQAQLKAYPFMKFDIHTARNAEEAMLLTDQKPPQMVVLDALTGSDMNGYDVARWMRSHPDCEGTKILLVSALDDSLNETMALRAGADAYLVKNAPAQKLHDMLNQLLVG